MHSYVRARSNLYLGPPYSIHPEPIVDVRPGAHDPLRLLRPGKPDPSKLVLASRGPRVDTVDNLDTENALVFGNLLRRIPCNRMNIGNTDHYNTRQRQSKNCQQPCCDHLSVVGHLLGRVPPAFEI